MANYQTPGVYVEEIPKLPPSVAQVATAIPAFIGYTEKAQEIAPGDLDGKPKKISSLVEFELFYGYGPAPDVTEINIDSNNNFISATVSNKFFLYDSLRMYFANGGGDCFIVSIGNYQVTSMSDTDFTDGIKELEKEDDPTIILFPDAVALGDSEIAAVQQAALSQCGTLMDRVGLFDVKLDDPNGVTFRNNIGINNLSYGAVYSPWLKVALPKKIQYPDVVNIKKAGVNTTIDGLSTDPDVLALITEVEQAYADLENISNKTQSLAPPNGVMGDVFAGLESDLVSSNDNPNLIKVFEFIYSIGGLINEYLNGPDVLTLPDLLNDVTYSITDLDELFALVRALELEANGDLSISPDLDIAAMFPPATWPQVDGASVGTPLLGGTAVLEDKRIIALNYLRTYFTEISKIYYSKFVDAAINYTKTKDDALALGFPVYQTILTGIGKSVTTMPPSGAIAGIYAMVDRTRGVWKAPANVSVSNVVGPNTIFSKSELDSLNVDPIAGKSVNAIRPFFGKGTLVFGARTLAGNNNEWRYISVRRFFNMVEESTKKATEQFVFEPNDANTWVKVQGMIDNFLNTLWRQGALQGAKPEHAYYVAVGLGKTMTALDILEGRMIVEIGMAVVRPAEFIILRFSHKLAES